MFELVHGDLWDPYPEPNICETKYMFTLVEDHIRMVWTCMLHSKDQAYEVFKSFLEMIKTQFQKKLKIFKSDNRGEFIGNTMKQLFSDHGILHQRSYPYSPQQNGIMERKHHTLLDTT